MVFAKTGLPVEKREDESGAGQQRVKLPINVAIDDYAKDGGEELFAKMHCVL